MPNGEYDLHDVKNDLKSVKDTQQTIIECLRGDDKKHSDAGLIGDVNKNTDWRKASKKWIYVITTIIIGALIKYFIEFI